jgi:hypothetical protein
MKKYILLCTVFILSLVGSIQSGAAKPSAEIRFTSFTDGAVAPANWKHPIVEWNDARGGRRAYVLKVRSSKHSLDIPVMSGTRYLFRDESFVPFLSDQRVSFQIVSGDRRSSDIVTVTIDRVTFDDRIVFRMVEPLFNPKQDAVIMSMTLSEGEPKMFCKIGKTCIGCHAHNGEGSLLNLKRNNDRRFIVARSLKGSDSFQQYVFGEFSFLSLSPSGRHAVFARNSLSMIEIKKTFIDPFDMTYVAGELAIFDMTANTVKPLAGADDKEYVNDMPSWSPDGETIVFCRYKPNMKENRLNPVTIYTIPFGDGDGGDPEPLLEKAPGPYCYFPRYSPDGRFVSFVCGDASKGYFARNRSDIWLYDIERKKLRKLTCNMPDMMNSWHAWSTDGRWMVFSTKRSAGNLTSLYLVKIEKDGADHPAVKISYHDRYKVNLPYVVPGDVGLDYGGNLIRFVNSIMKK